MQLLIDPSGGMAGDMFAAALMAAGADEKQMIDAMQLAANKIGQAHISLTKSKDAAYRLKMTMQHNHGHLSGHRARHLLEAIFDTLSLASVYRQFGFQALEILIEAEIKAHKENTFLSDHLHAHEHHSAVDHQHGPHAEAYLHEAQDILIDITGAAMGLQLLNGPTRAWLLAPVSLGGGYIRFSHGHLPVPAPATKIIFDRYALPATKGPIDRELCTPTGAAILAALHASLTSDSDFEVRVEGFARGSRDYPIPPLHLMLS